MSSQIEIQAGNNVQQGNMLVNDAMPQWKKYGFAIAIIFCMGGLIVCGVGNIHQVHAVIMRGIGVGVAGISLLAIIGLIVANNTNTSATHVTTTPTSPPYGKTNSSPKVIKDKIVEIESFIEKKSGLQEKIALGARFHLSGFNRPCKYPRILGCGTPFLNSDREKLCVKSRQFLFDELSANLQRALNGFEKLGKNSILDEVLRLQILKYELTVHQMEQDLCNDLNKSDVLKVLKFDDQELRGYTLDESIKSNLRQRLTQPLRDRLNQFAAETQGNLLTSAYCQLKAIKTGNEVIIYC